MSAFPGLFAGIGLLPQHLADSIAQVRAFFGDPAGGKIEYGTGFLIRQAGNRSYLATAAHVLFKRDYGLPVRIEVYLGQRSDSCAKALTIYGQDKPFFVPDEFTGSNNPPAGSDYGLIRIDNDAGSLANFHHFVASSANPVQSIVRLYGYPKDGINPQSDDPYYTVLEAIPEGTECFSYAHTPDQPAPTAPATYRGMSGGPLIGNSSTDRTNRVFGIHTRGDDGIRATRMSETVRNTMKSWIGAV